MKSTLNIFSSKRQLVLVIFALASSLSWGFSGLHSNRRPASVSSSPPATRNRNIISKNKNHDEEQEPEQISEDMRLHESKTYDVIIVGGGLAGLALSIGLATHLPGLSIAVIEKRPFFSRAGATLGLAANGIRALEMLCGDKKLVELVHDFGFSIPTLDKLPPVMIIPWWTLRDLLLERAQELKSFPDQHGESGGGGDSSSTNDARLHIFTDLSIDQLDQPNEADDESTLATLHFSNSDHVLQGKLVVGADGVHSTIREIIGMPPAIDTGNTVFRGNLICQPGVPNEDSSGDYNESHYETSLLSSLLTKGPFPFDLRDSDKTYFSVFNHNESNPGLLLWALGTPRQIKGASVDKLVGLFQNVLVDDQNEDRKSIFTKILQNTDSIQETKLCVQDMMKLPVNGGWGGRNRVTLIGDAAHACRPTHGQGANMAFEDCAVLCQMLIAARTEIDATASCNKFITDFEKARLPRVKRIHDDQRIRAELKSEQWSPWTPEFMDWVYNGSFI